MELYLRKGTQEESEEIPARFIAIGFTFTNLYVLTNRQLKVPETAAGGRRVSSRQRGNEQAGISHAIDHPEAGRKRASRKF